MGNAVRHLRNMAITKLKPTQVRGSRRVPSHFSIHSPEHHTDNKEAGFQRGSSVKTRVPVWMPRGTQQKERDQQS